MRTRSPRPILATAIMVVALLGCDAPAQTAPAPNPEDQAPAVAAQTAAAQQTASAPETKQAPPPQTAGPDVLFPAPTANPGRTQNLVLLMDGDWTIPASHNADLSLTEVFAAGRGIVLQYETSNDTFGAPSFSGNFYYTCTSGPRERAFPPLQWRESYAPDRRWLRVHMDYAEPYASAQRTCRAEGGEVAAIVGNLEAIASTQQRVTRQKLRIQSQASPQRRPVEDQSHTPTAGAFLATESRDQSAVLDGRWLILNANGGETAMAERVDLDFLGLFLSGGAFVAEFTSNDMLLRNVGAQPALKYYCGGPSIFGAAVQVETAYSSDRRTGRVTFRMDVAEAQRLCRGNLGELSKVTGTLRAAVQTAGSQHDVGLTLYSRP